MKKIVFLVFIVLFAFNAWAGTYYVRPSGGSYGNEDGSDYDNAWDGFTNINWGSLSGSNTLYVCGTHNETLTVGASGAGVGTELIIRGDYAGDAGLIDKNDDAVNQKGIQIDGDDYVKIYELDVTDTYSDAVDISDGTTYCILENMEISYGGDNIDISGANTHHNTVKNCILHHGGASAVGGGGGININEGAHDNTIEYCESYSNQEDGFALAGYPDCPASWPGSVAGSNNTIQYCHAHDNDEDGIDIKGYVSPIIQYNLVENCGQKGICMWGISQETIVRYNWIETCGSAAVWFQQTDGGCDVNYNSHMGHKIYGNVIKGRIGYVNTAWNEYDNADMFYNNTIYCSVDLPIVNGRDYPHEFKNNIIVSTQAGNDMLDFGADSSDTSLVLDYNIYYNSNGSSEIAVNLSSGTSDPYSVAEVEDGTLYSEKSLEQHGKGQDPKLNNPSIDDFSLQSKSPAINNAVDLGAEFKYRLHPGMRKSDFGTAGTVILVEQAELEIGAYGYTGTVEIIKGLIQGTIQ